MANLYYPQLLSGALAQYPIRKTRIVRTIKNVLQDGSMILYSDPGGRHLVWQLSYVDLCASDADALQTHFKACAGPFHAFTFIDPTDNMLAWSSDLTNAAWQTSSLIHIAPGATDPTGGSAAFTVTNTGQATQEITQTLAVPANYQYCFSVYVLAAQESTISLFRQGVATQQNTNVPISQSWTRIVSSGALSDQGASFSVGITLAPGQQVELYGIQLEAQVAPSRYRPTSQVGGVYSNAHWAVSELNVTAEAPNLFATSFSIETTI